MAKVEGFVVTLGHACAHAFSLWERIKCLAPVATETKRSLRVTEGGRGRHGVSIQMTEALQ
jgi:hypothetical protein